MPYSTSLNSTIFFLLIFIVAFFPGAFIYLVKLPFHPFTASPAATLRPTTSTACACCSSPASPVPTMSWFQKSFTLPSRSRGSYLITPHVTSNLPEISTYKVGILHLFIQHTSCALSLNENYDQDVRADMSDALDRIVPEDVGGKGIYRHDAEGSDDMPVRATPRI